MKIELLTQKNCPKCEWFKEYIVPALKLKGFEIEEKSKYDYNLFFFVDNNIQYKSTPTLLIWNDKNELLIMDKGLILKNIETEIRKHCK